MKSIAYIYQDQYPWDIRADKITGSLANAGFNTYIISRNRNAKLRYETLKSHLHVVRLPGTKLNILNTLLNFPAFFSPVWIWVIFRTVKKNDIRLLIVRDLPLSPAAWLVSRICNIPVIMDMAENYPAMIQDTWNHRGPDKYDFLLRNPKMLRSLEKWIIPKFSGIITVSEASNERIKSMIHYRHDNVWVIENVPRLDNAQKYIRSETSDYMNDLEGIKLLYVGGLEESRGLMIAIKALNHLISSGTIAHLIIVGDGTSRQSLEKKAKELNILDYVLFAGWLDQSLISNIISKADICLVPHLVTEHIDTTIPNKIYDYMAQEKPVLVTHSKSLKYIVEKYQCGYWYQDENYEALSLLIDKLKDVSLRSSLGISGKRIIHENLNWTNESKKLLNIVEHTIE